MRVNGAREKMNCVQPIDQLDKILTRQSMLILPTHPGPFEHWEAEWLESLWEEIALRQKVNKLG